jgi:hypothetical protein
MDRKLMRKLLWLILLVAMPTFGQMTQIVSYGFTTVENPLSDGGNFTTNPSMSALKVPTSGECEATVTSTHCGAYWSGAVVQSGGTWPADQYSEVTLLGFDAASYIIPIVRASASANTQYRLYIQMGASHSFLYAIVAGTANLLATYTIIPVAGDVWRLSVTGEVLSVSQNGSVVQTFTDTNNYVPSGSPSFDIFADATASVIVSKWAAGANQAATPTFSPVAGTYTGTQTVTVTSSTSGGTIYYTTNGTTPTHSSSSISNGGTVSVSATGTLKVFESASDFADSTTGSAAYTINAASNHAPPMVVR